jgi:hypothetical protein
MLPTGKESSMRVVTYGAEVAGRLQGAAELHMLVPDEAHRAAVEPR